MHPMELHNDKLRNIAGFIQLYSLKCRCICHMKFLCIYFLCIPPITSLNIQWREKIATFVIGKCLHTAYVKLSVSRATKMQSPMNVLPMAAVPSPGPASQMVLVPASRGPHRPPPPRRTTPPPSPGSSVKPRL